MGKPGKEKNVSTGPSRGGGRGRGRGGASRGRGATTRGGARGGARAVPGPSTHGQEVDWEVDMPKRRTWDEDEGEYLPASYLT